MVERSGCAAAMRSVAEWRAHAQGRAVAKEPLVRRLTGSTANRSERRRDFRTPFSDFRVLDMTRVLAGPVATQFLAGFGADVLRIDPPDWEEPGVVPDVTLGKRCARLDLRPEDRTSWECLLADADVLVHGHRPGALAALGLGEERRGILRPDLVDVSLDAYGWAGPWRDRRGFDSLVQMSTGIAEAGMGWSNADRPAPLPVQALDHATGYLMAAAAVRGLTEQLKSGRGSSARASLARTAMLLTERDGGAQEPISALMSTDLAKDLEHTPWGEARRLKAPGGIEGVRCDGSCLLAYSDPRPRRGDWPEGTRRAPSSSKARLRTASSLEPYAAPTERGRGSPAMSVMAIRSGRVPGPANRRAARHRGPNVRDRGQRGGGGLRRGGRRAAHAARQPNCSGAGRLGD